MARYEGSYHDGRRAGSPHHHVNTGEPYTRVADSRMYKPRNHNNHHHHNNGEYNTHTHPDPRIAALLPPKKRSTLFNNKGPARHGDGRDAIFGKNRRPAHEMHPFSSFMPFSIDSHPKAVQLSADVKRKFHEANLDVSKEGLYMDYIYRSWARTPDRPLSEVHRYHAFRKMLECGSVDEISAEVFHFLCGIHQCKYGDGFMRDDMELCDCDGKVPRCFVAAYIELARKLHRTEKKLAEANRVLKATPGRSPRTTTRPSLAVTVEDVIE
ncbi:hypothetical protein SBRCBS47491_009591 [Sporothrix bragantina]|uniref:Uncharacterized protein n=1 Tax=Sporothrix bragantina TaxID=671064 RepID=A0ABP0CZ63_9PEZI